MSALSLCLTMSAVSGCTVTSDGCAWARKIELNEATDRVSKETENAIIAHNAKVARFCR